MASLTENKASAHPESEKLAAREMRGEGDYTASTKGCFDVINSAAVSAEVVPHCFFLFNLQMMFRTELLSKSTPW